MIKLAKLVFISTILGMSSLSFGAASSQTIPLSFEECIARREVVISQMGVSPRDIIPVVNTQIMTVTKVCTVDGSVLVTCSKPDRKMILTKSTSSCR